MDLQKEIEKLKVKAGYDGKPQQWQYGFDLACRELAKAQAVPEGFVVVTKEPTRKMIDAGMDNFCFPLDNGRFYSHDIILAYRAMIEAAQE